MTTLRANASGPRRALVRKVVGRRMEAENEDVADESGETITFRRVTGDAALGAL